MDVKVTFPKYYVQLWNKKRVTKSRLITNIYFIWQICVMDIDKIYNFH